MILFLLLLLSSGLMYYYFQRSSRMDAELAIWRSGGKPTAEQLENAERSLFTNPGSVFRNLPASKLLDRADDALPDGEIADPPLLDAPQDDDKPAATPPPAPTARATAAPAVADGPAARPPTETPVQVPSSPFAPGVEERREIGRASWRERV